MGINKNTKVAIAMSGGVDSAVAAALLVKQGFKVTGVHLHLWCESGVTRENKCCSTESLEAARSTTNLLKIPFHVFDFADIFKNSVVNYFLKEYGLGQTPNPCVACNRFIKFGALLDYVKAMDFDFLATGHYCQLISKDHIYHLLAGKDTKKDQSYFLYNLNQKQLAHLLFPLGNLTKPEVRQIARDLKLPVANRPESQEICFFAENDYRPFLKRHLKIKPGYVVNTAGQIIGTHHGLPLYTIGQRHGFEIKIKKLIPPFYVIAKDISKNQLIVGFGPETEIKVFKIKDTSWLSKSPQPESLLVKIRHQGELLKCRLKDNKVSLSEPRRGISPGQSAVFYQSWDKNFEVLGGGIICS